MRLYLYERSTLVEKWDKPEIDGPTLPPPQFLPDDVKLAVMNTAFKAAEGRTMMMNFVWLNAHEYIWHVHVRDQHLMLRLINYEPPAWPF